MEKLASFISKAKSSGSAVIIAEHRLSYLASVADRYLLFEGGSVAAEWDAQRFLGAVRRGARVLRAQVLRAAEARRPDAAPFPSRLRLSAVEARESMRGTRGACRSSRGLPSRSTPGGSSAWSGVTEGKSTLLKCLAGIKKEELGHVRFQGSVIPPKRRPNHAFLVMRKTPTTSSFARACARVGIRGPVSFRRRRTSSRSGPGGVWPGRCRRPPSRIALGGQKQRCVCAIASESGAQALLLDEPTSGLDFRNMERLALILREETSRGKTVAVVSHDTEFLSKACDQIVLIE